MKLLSNLLEGITLENIHGNINNSVSSVSLDSRIISPNSLFIAIKGNVLDGHNFIDEVIRNGAKTVIHEKTLSNYEQGVTYVQVEDTHDVVGIIASNFYNNPSRKMKLVGVTGTNGKTTTATLLHQLFRNLGYKVGMIGTVVNKINDNSFEALRTTPDSITLNKLLSDMINDGCEYCFMEVSSHAVSEKRVNGISFAGGIFTNLTLDHLDYHKTLENYAMAKKSFFEMIPSTGFAIANIDDQKGKYMLDGIEAKKYTFSLKNNADFNEILETKLLGEFNVYNILGVYACAVLLGQDKERVKEIIKGLEPVAGRFQYIKSKKGVIGIVDYAHTPDALLNVLKTINQMKEKGKVISIIGCGGDRDKSKRPIMAKIGFDMSDKLILTSDNPRTERPEDILNDMQKGLPLDGVDSVEIIIDRHMAIIKACEIAKSGDYILLAGKGHENYQEVNGVKHHFDDMEELQKYLR